MKRLATPEGLRELYEKEEPLHLSRGALPFGEGARKDVVEHRPVQDRKVQEVRSIVGYDQEQVLFTLAPLYWLLKVPFDLVDQFSKSEYGAGVCTLRLGTAFKLFEDIPGWENVIETMDKEHWDKFAQFMGECTFQRGTNFWTVCGQRVQLPSGIPVAVFTPRDMINGFDVWTDKEGIIRLSARVMTDNGGDWTSRMSNLLLKQKGGSR